MCQPQKAMFPPFGYMTQRDRESDNPAGVRGGLAVAEVVLVQVDSQEMQLSLWRSERQLEELQDQPG